MIKNIDEIIQLFKKNNLKLTLQRANIYSYLMSTDEHPTVDTIYKNIKCIMPTISLATVYKTLNTLVESGLIKIINVCEENFRYDSNTNLHGHIKCEICNRIEDLCIDKNLTNSIIKYGNNIKYFDLFLYGTCDKCLKNTVISK